MLRKFFLSLLFTSLVQQQAVACQAGYTVGFFNGVWNTPDDAKRNMDALELTYGKSTHNGLPVTYLLFYNQTGCGGVNATCLQDIAETFIQRSNELDPSGTLSKDFGLFWEAIAGGTSYADKLASFIPNLAGVIADVYSAVSVRVSTGISYSFSNPPSVVDATAHNADLDVLATNKQNLILVAHSQGNLFLNSAYDHIQPTLGASGVQAVHIAPATTNMRGDYVLSNYDLVIDGLSLVGGKAPSNLTLFSNPIDVSGHKFRETYLNPTMTGYFENYPQTPATVTTKLLDRAFGRLGTPKCLAAICPDTFTQTQLSQIVPGTTIAKADEVFGCVGFSAGVSNWRMWYNNTSLMSMTLNTASVFFTNGVYLAGNGKSISGNVIP